MNINHTDKTLCEVNQSQENFEELYQRYWQTVFKHCLVMTKDYHLAQDYTQDIFGKVFLHLTSFESKAKFSTWLKVIANNHFFDQKRRSMKLPLLLLDQESLEFRQPIDQGEGTPLEEQVNRLNLSMNTLTELDQTLLRMKYEHGFPLERICQHYNLPISSVKMRLLRGKRRVRQHYQSCLFQEL